MRSTPNEPQRPPLAPAPAIPAFARNLRSRRQPASKSYAVPYDRPPQPAYTRVAPPERTPAAIRAELRAQFEAGYRAALDDARTSYRLDRVNKVVEA